MQFFQQSIQRLLKSRGSGELKEGKPPSPPPPESSILLFHQSIEDLLKRRNTKFQEHSQYSFLRTFCKFYSKELGLWRGEFFEKINIFLEYYLSILGKKISEVLEL